MNYVRWHHSSCTNRINGGTPSIIGSFVVLLFVPVDVVVASAPTDFPAPLPLPASKLAAAVGALLEADVEPLEAVDLFHAE